VLRAAGFLEPSPNLTEDAPIMTIPPEREAQILRCRHIEKWPPATIARHLNINRGTVMRVLAQAGLPRIGLAATPVADRSLSALHMSASSHAGTGRAMIFDQVVAISSGSIPWNRAASGIFDKASWDVGSM
jgi:hypothetical protein